jgi:hypothetical protein
MSEKERFHERIPNFYKKAAAVLVLIVGSIAVVNYMLAIKEAQLLAAI